MNKAGNSKNSRTKHYIKFNLYKEYYYRLLLDVKNLAARLF